MEPQFSYDGPEWFCIIVEPGYHRQIRAVLLDKGYRPFLPMAKRWVSHARVKKVSEKPILGRYMFVEVDHPRQSFEPLMSTDGVEAIISNGGIPWPVPRAEVNALLERYLAGEFDETKGNPPVGARVAIVAGKFEDWIATVTAIGKNGRRLGVKILGHNLHLNDVSVHSVRPALGSDLKRQNPDVVPERV